MSARGRRPSVPAGALGIFLLAAVAFGAAAALLAGPASPLAPTIGTDSAPGGYLAFEIGAIIVLFGFLLFILLQVIRRLRSGGMPIPGRVAATLVMVFLVMAVFVLLFHFVSPPGLGTSHGSTTPGGTNSSPPQGGGSGGLGTNLTFPGGISVPGWTVYAGLGATALVVALVALPLLLAARARRSDHLEEEKVAPSAARQSIARALRELEDVTDPDVRRRIILSYAQLLERVEHPALDGDAQDVGALTPRDIETLCVVRLHVGAATARELTRLFEEARYSTHSLGEPDAKRARDALLRALDDLEHRSGRK